MGFLSQDCFLTPPKKNYIFVLLPQKQRHRLSSQYCRWCVAGVKSHLFFPALLDKQSPPNPPFFFLFLFSRRTTKDNKYRSNLERIKRRTGDGGSAVQSVFFTVGLTQKRASIMQEPAASGAQKFGGEQKVNSQVRTSEAAFMSARVRERERERE